MAARSVNKHSSVEHAAQIALQKSLWDAKDLTRAVASVVHCWDFGGEAPVLSCQ